MSRKFKIVREVWQGSILSPFLFNFTIDWIMEQALSNDLFGITLNDMMVADLGFADDICLIDDNGNDAQKLRDNVTNNALRVCLQTVRWKN